MKTIKFIPTGKAISDFEISKFVDEMLTSEEQEFHISTNLVIDEIRARIVERKIGLDDLHIYVADEFGGETYFTIDKNGRSNDFEKSQDIHTDILTRIILGAKQNK